MHRQLECCAPFSRLLQDDVSRLDLVNALSLLYTFIDGLESVLLPRLRETPYRSLYRPRRALLAADLAALGQATPAPQALVLPQSALSLLGVIYAVEGSALGGQVLARHLATRLAPRDALALGYFSALAEGMGAHWQQVLGALRQALVGPEEIDQVTTGVHLVFSTLLRLAQQGQVQQ